MLISILNIIGLSFDGLGVFFLFNTIALKEYPKYSNYMSRQDYFELEERIIKNIENINKGLREDFNKSKKYFCLIVVGFTFQIVANIIPFIEK